MAVHHAYPKAEKVEIDGEIHGRLDLQSALNRAQPGDTVLLAPGVYDQPVVITRGGKRREMITLRPRLPGSVLMDGRRKPEDGLSGGLEPMDGDWAMVKIFGAGHISIEGLRFANCWPQAIYLRGASDLAIRDVSITGSRYAVYARTLDERPTERLLLDRVKWVQDPDHDMWDGRATWKEVKARPGKTDKSWFNGALFGAFDIPGDVVIRECDVSHAFNAIRVDIRNERVEEDEEGGDLRMTRNRNFRIIGNRFSFIRDNAIEPEMGAEGWLVADNLFAQNHAALSLDGVALKNFAFVGNKLLNSLRPGGPDDPSQSGGKIIKFLDDGDVIKDGAKPKPAVNFVTAFNSVRTRTRYIQDAALKPWTDRNNAVERFCSDDPRDNLQLFSETIWAKGASISGMATNAPDYPASGHLIKPPRGPAPVTGTHPRMDAIFEGDPAPPDPTKPLGGWNGRLPRRRAVCEAISVPVKIYGPDGRTALCGGNPGVGYRSLKKLKLKSWAEPGWVKRLA